MSLTIARCSPNSAFSSVDLPTFGAPMMATGIPFRIALPVRNEAISEASFLSISAAKSFSSVRSANSNSSWSAKSSSNSISDVKCSNRSRSLDSSVDTDPRNWLIAKSFSALLCDAIKSATASACARSILPFIKARRVYSPGSAALHPTSISHRSISCWMKRLPWQAISTVSSPVNECGARYTVQSTSSSTSPSRAIRPK